LSWLIIECEETLVKLFLKFIHVAYFFVHLKVFIAEEVNEDGVLEFTSFFLSGDVLVEVH
jgi:hypothetical protein